MTSPLRLLRVEEHANLESTLGHAESLLGIRRFVTSPGVAGTPVAMALKDLLPGDENFLNWQWREAAKRIADFFSSGQIEVLGKYQAWIQVHVLSLYRPNVEGAKASVTFEVTAGQEKTFSVDIFGSGGGAEFTVELGWSDKIESDHESVTVLYELLAEWQICRLVRNGAATHSFAQLKQLGKADRTQVRALAPLYAPLDKEGASTPVTLDLRGQTAMLTRTLTAKSGTQWRGSIGVEIEKFGVKAKAEYVGTRLNETTYEYSLPGGYIYRARQFETSPDWWWDIEAG
jgi:hypothetical protein